MSSRINDYKYEVLFNFSDSERENVGVLKIIFHYEFSKENLIWHKA